MDNLYALKDQILVDYPIIIRQANLLKIQQLQGEESKYFIKWISKQADKCEVEDRLNKEELKIILSYGGIQDNKIRERTATMLGL